MKEETRILPGGHDLRGIEVFTLYLVTKLFLIDLGTLRPGSEELKQMFVGLILCSDLLPPRNSLAKY